MIKVFDKADKIFDLVARHAPISFTNLMNLTEINKATLSQILSSMVQLGWLRKNTKGHYRIGESIITYGESSVINPKLYDVCKRVAKKLHEELNELVTVAVFHHGKRRVIIKYIPDQVVQVNEDYNSSPGSMFETATGLVLFSGLSENIRDIFIKDHKLESDFLDIQEEFSNLEREGFCELLKGRRDLVSYSAGVFNSEGEMVGALGFSLPCYRQEFDREKASKILDKYTKMISGRI